MDKITAGILGVGGPALFFVVVWGASGSLYQTTSIPVAPPPPTVEEPEEEAAEAAPAEEAPQEDLAAAEAPEADEPAEAEQPEETAVAATDETADAPEAEETAQEDVPEAEAPAAAAETTASEETTPEPAAEPASLDLAAVAEAGDLRAGGRVWRQCSACHVADQEQNRVGPHLVDVLGRARASVEDFRYSDALTALEGTWTIEALNAWLESPRDYAPGTSMSYRGLADAEDRANLLAYLADLQLN